MDGHNHYGQPFVNQKIIDRCNELYIGEPKKIIISPEQEQNEYKNQC